jgi:hypothetical protein
MLIVKTNYMNFLALYPESSVTNTSQVVITSAYLNYGTMFLLTSLKIRNSDTFLDKEDRHTQLTETVH